MITLTVYNNKTTIEGADCYVLEAIDQVLRYPSEVALAKSCHVELPEELQSWDGWVLMLHITTTKPPWCLTGLISYVTGVLSNLGVQYMVIDARERPEDNIPELGVDIPLRNYQKEAVSAACKYGRGVLDMVPRSGKTRIACEIQRRLSRNTLWLAPTREIVKQTKRVLDSFFWKDYSYHLVGSGNAKQASEHKVVLCTPNTACKLTDDFYNTRDCVIVDEFHRSAASMYYAIFKKCDHIFYRFGMTGTFFRSGEDAMALYAQLSNTLYKVTSADLIDKGFLVPTHVVYLPVLGTLQVKKGAYSVAHGKHGISEYKYRNQLVAQTSVLLQRTGRSVLILVDTKKQGRLIRDILFNFFVVNNQSEFKAVEFVCSETPGFKIKEVLESFINKESVKILIGTSVLGEGIDLPTADSLVYAMGKKAEVSLIQNAYRVGTAVEGKNHAIMVDFADRHHKKLMNHTLERIRIFYNEPTFNLEVLDSANDFKSWLSNYKYEAY